MNDDVCDHAYMENRTNFNLKKYMHLQHLIRTSLRRQQVLRRLRIGYTLFLIKHKT